MSLYLGTNVRMPQFFDGEIIFPLCSGSYYNGLYVAAWTVFSVICTALDSSTLSTVLLVEENLMRNKVSCSKLGCWKENKMRTAKIWEQRFQIEICQFNQKKNKNLSFCIFDQCCYNCVLQLHQYILVCQEINKKN